MKPARTLTTLALAVVIGAGAAVAADEKKAKDALAKPAIAKSDLKSARPAKP